VAILQPKAERFILRHGTRRHDLLGHSGWFVYENRDEVLPRFADAITSGLDSRLDDVVRHDGGACDTLACFHPIE
jgi:hypothetical protein